MAENLLVIFSCSSVKFELSDNCVFKLKNIMFEITPIIFWADLAHVSGTDIKMRI